MIVCWLLLLLFLRQRLDVNESRTERRIRRKKDVAALSATRFSEKEVQQRLNGARNRKAAGEGVWGPPRSPSNTFMVKGQFLHSSSVCASLSVSIQRFSVCLIY